MARNPLVSDPTREHRVRERAYHLWEADGKPHGRDVEYWERARELVSTEESAANGKPPNEKSPDEKSSGRVGSPDRQVAVEPAKGGGKAGKIATQTADAPEMKPAGKAAPAAKRRGGTAAKRPKS
jgi:hypothetical protein